MAEFDKALELLLSRSRQLSVELSAKQVSSLQRYCEALAQYNAHTNLVSDAAPETLVSDHIIDSLTLVKFIEDFKKRKRDHAKPISLIDIGSGAGLPGMILAIARPDAEVTLLDSVAKKVRFLQSFIEEDADLSARVHAICERAETLAHQKRYREKFDVATARAVGSLELVAELAIPFLQVTGELYVQKSLGQLQDASREAARVLPRLGAAVIETTALDSRILGKERAVIVVEKRTQTAAKYPRDWAQMKSKPLASGN
jgi:16S rRNA (guanine527-N7)-methyltransferase